MDIKNINIIIIDDEEMIRGLIKDFLEDRGLSVESAENGGEGLKLLLKKKFDAAIVDVRLPDMSGNEFIIKAYKIQSGTCFMIHTGHIEYKPSPELLKIGISMESVIIKPIMDLNVLYDKILGGIMKKMDNAG